MEDEDMRHHFVHGLKKSVHWAVDRASPATLEDAFTVSLTEDIDFVASLSALQTTQQRNLAPQTTAMDVDAIHAPRFNRLTDEEHAYLRSINACFHCRQPGHCSNTCPLNNSHSCQQQFHQCRSPQVNSFEMMPQYYHGYPMSFRPGFMPMYPGYSFPPALPQQQQQPLPGQVSTASPPVVSNTSTTSYSDGPIIISSFDGVAFSPFLVTVLIAGQPCVVLFDSGCTGMVLGE
ncbi:hypothetical protein GGI16_005201 [Coemansia sp. S142-1]|nr:hypothetical protein GGI16_005201 [Coemansia sp. S142-1]